MNMFLGGANLIWYFCVKQLVLYAIVRAFSGIYARYRVEQATRFFDRYDETNNAANAERDARSIATIETGPVLEASLTGYELAAANDAEPPEAYYHTEISAYSPRFTEYPMWFVATARINNDPSSSAVLAVTRSPIIAWTSNVFAILGLRSLYFVLAGLLDRFHLLHYGLGIILAFVSLKMLAAQWIHIPTLLSLCVILATVAAFITLSLVLKPAHK